MSGVGVVSATVSRETQSRGRAEVPPWSGDSAEIPRADLADPGPPSPSPTSHETGRGADVTASSTAAIAEPSAVAIAEPSAVAAAEPPVSRETVTPALARIVLLPIRTYRRFLSPALGARCRYYPTCSAYAEQSIRELGAVRGTILAAWRVLRCNPLSKGGLDPVSERRFFRSTVDAYAHTHTHDDDHTHAHGDSA